METNDKRRRAKKRVEQIKGFYIHLMVYILINAVILVAIMVQSYNQGEALLRWPSLWTPVLWGIGLAFHAAKVFAWSPFFGKQWEEAQIRKFMEQDRREAEKYNSKDRDNS